MEKASPAEQEGRAIAFLLSLSRLFPSSSPCPGSVTFPYTPSVSPKRCVGAFALNPERRVPHPALLLTAPAACQSCGEEGGGGHLQEPNEVLSWVQQSSLGTPGRLPLLPSLSYGLRHLPRCRGSVPREGASPRARRRVAQALRDRDVSLPPASGGNTQTLRYCCETNREQRFANRPSA